MANLSTNSTTAATGPVQPASMPSNSCQLHGYQRMAQMMGKSDDLAIFRRFSDLNMLSLLSLQAETLELRDDFYDTCEQDEAAGENFSISMLQLLESKGSQNQKQYKQLMRIRGKMRQYNALLLQVSKLSKLNKPRDSYFSSLREWLRDPSGGKSKGIFKGKEAFIWEKEDVRNQKIEHDFVTIATPRGERDLFTKLVLYPLVSFYHWIWGRKRLNKRFVLDEESGLVEYSEEKIDKIGMIISTAVASVLPVVAVLGLFFVKDLLKRIYIMIGITAGFAILLAVLSSGKRIEIFAATATFAAVEVVFIGSTSVYFGNQNSQN